MALWCVSCLLCSAVGSSAAEPRADLLVAMSRSGRIERYDTETGRWLGTFIYGVPHPNGLAWGPDGRLYISVGDLNCQGKVLRYDGLTGAYVGELANYPPGTDGHLLRANGLVFHEGDLFVVGCDNGRISRYDASTGAWKQDFASVSTTSVTQIRFRDGFLYATDFRSGSILRFSAATGEPVEPLTRLASFAPWGLAIDPTGRVFWSGNDGTVRLVGGGTNAVWAGGEGRLQIPLWLETGPDGRLYCSDYGAGSVEAWSLATGERVLRIEGTEVRGPVGLAFTTYPMPQRSLVVLGARRPEPRGNPMVSLQAVSDAPLVTHLGWDTEGGDRARHNLLRAPLELRVRLAGEWRNAGELPVQGGATGDEDVGYRVGVTPAATLEWRLHVEGGRFTMRFGLSGAKREQVEGLELRFPLDPRLCATTVLSGQWDDGGALQLPAVISAPDLGQMLVRCPGRPEVQGRLRGNRAEQWVDLTLELPAPGARGYSLEFVPVRLPAPQGLHDTAGRWPAARRGWFSFLQPNAQERGSGVWANNVISNPVSSTVFWLGDQVLLVPEAAPGVPLTPLLRRTLEFWLHEGIEPDGLIHYVETGHSSPMMDANPAVLIGAWCYVEASRDEPWLREQMERLEFVAAYFEGRDIDDDGLVESTQSGNRGTHTFGETAWDTYSSGHKNAYVNALAYRAFRCLADLERQLGRTAQQARYAARADRLKAIYRDTFYNPDTGWLGWWRSEDGFLHEVYSDVPTDLATMYGLIEPEEARPMLDAYWREVERSGFRRFDLGVPLNTRPVPRDDQYGEWGGKAEDGSDTFGKYLNGGCCVSNAYFTLVANYIAGDPARADRLLDAMLKRQAEGAFPNGGGFQNGVVNRYPEGAEFFDWDGNTCGYEGHLVYSWLFLQAVLLREPSFRERLFRTLQ